MSLVKHHATIGRSPIKPQDVPRGRPNCGMVALAHFTDQPYERVERFLKPLYPHNWKGSTRHNDYRMFFARIGLKVAYDKYTKKSEQLTLAQWAAKVAQPGRRYMVITTGHAQVVYNGQVIDQSVDKPVHPADYRWGRKMVKSWYSFGEVQA